MPTFKLGITLLSLCAGAQLACGPEFAVTPHGGVPQASASASGAMITAFAEQWIGDPRDLADSLTPIAVDIYNGTALEIRVSYADFALRNDRGVRLPALNPFQTQVSSNDEALQPGPLLAGPLVGPSGAVITSALPAAFGHGGGGFHGGFRGGSRGVSRSYGRGGFGGTHLYGGGGYGRGPRWGAGFHVHGGLRGYYGPGALYWGGPWYLTPGYSDYVYGWSNGGYRYQPSGDVIELGVPEGVLAPGAHINGFLYFQKATAPDVRTLTLTWEPHDARTDANVPVGNAQIALDVTRH